MPEPPLCFSALSAISRHSNFVTATRGIASQTFGRGVTGFVSGMTKLGPWISFRSKRQLVAVTNTLYALIAKDKMGSEERAAWALALISTSPRQQFHAIARRYPDGLVKLEPHDLNSLRLPTPLRTKDAPEAYVRCHRPPRRGKREGSGCYCRWVYE